MAAPSPLPAAGPRPPVVTRVLRRCAALFDRIAAVCEGAVAQRRLGTVLVVTFVASLLVIELNRRGLVPRGWAGPLTTNHLGAIYVAFTLLLVVEVVGLVLALPRSVADSLGKQFELLALILLRKVFMELAHFGEPVRWAEVSGRIPVIAADAVGALLVFVVLGFYYRVQRHLPITGGEEERASFVAAKKGVALLLLAAFAALAVRDGWRFATGAGTDTFFETFYTILIFSDVLLVLVALRYSGHFPVVFRNSGFAAATVLIRLALTAPPYYNALLGVGASLFALCLAAAYNAFIPTAGERGTLVHRGAEPLPPR